MNSAPLISRRRHYFYVLVFSVFICLFIGMVLGIFVPQYIEMDCAWCDIRPHDQYADLGFFYYGAGALLCGFVYSFIFHRIMLVANSFPEDKEVPLSRFAQYGRMLLGLRGFMILLAFLAVYFLGRFLMPIPERVQTSKMACFAYKGNAEEFKKGLEKGYAINYRLLFTAVTLDRVEIVRLLIAKGAEVNLKGYKSQTPLHCAAANGHNAIAELLIAGGAKVNAKDEDDETPLHLAAGYGHNAVAELLIARGADVNAKSNKGSTPLHLAPKWGNKVVAELLIAKGAQVNSKGKDGMTPLHWAAIYGNKTIAELLIAMGAEVNVKDNGGQTPLDRAIARHQSELVAGRPMDMTLAGNLIKVIKLLRSHGGKTGEELKAEKKK